MTTTQLRRQRLTPGQVKRARIYLERRKGRMSLERQARAMGVEPGVLRASLEGDETYLVSPDHLPPSPPRLLSIRQAELAVQAYWLHATPYSISRVFNVPEVIIWKLVRGIDYLDIDPPLVETKEVAYGWTPTPEETVQGE